VSGGGATLAFDLSGLALRLSGLDAELTVAFRDAWGPFVVDGAEELAWLDVDVAASGHRIVTRPTMSSAMESEVEPARARFACDEGSIELAAEGRASVRLGAGDPAWRFWGLSNLLAAALAYRLPSRPGALLHAAGVVIDGRAFLLTGASGSGKSTWARAAREAGARVVSDDTVVVDAASGVVELLGTPVRAHEAHPGGAGRWPVAALLHARWGTPPALAPVTPLAFHARLAANLPFLSSAWGREPRLDALADLLAARVAHRELTFAPDPGFVTLLRHTAF
jgi:hypothetical protein